MANRIPESTVKRLSLYLRYLREFAEQGRETVSSEDLAVRGRTTAAQVRKDLSYFGSFGKRGFGYQVGELRDRLQQILGLERTWQVAIIGAGRIGAALFGYQGFRVQGFHIVAVFDRDQQKVGVEWGDQRIEDVARMEEVIGERGIEIVIVTTPAEVAQDVVDRAVRAGVQGILNFAPTKLVVSEEVSLKNVDMAIELEALSFALSNHGASAPR